MINDRKFIIGLEKELAKLPYTKHLDDGQYNDGVLDGFELGAEWGYEKGKEIQEELAFKIFKAGQESMEDGGKSFDQYYKEIHGGK